MSNVRVQAGIILEPINFTDVEEKEINNSDMLNQIRFIDLFAGIGGFRWALERELGAKCVFTSEWDSYAQKTYKLNFDDNELHGDITKINAADIPAHEILCAGFPCQPFSIAGVSKANALGRNHGFKHPTQGTLFFDVKRIIETKRPRAFILENVKNLVGHDKGKTFDVIYRTLTKELGYTVYHKVIDANGYVPQHRERIFIVGFRDPLKFEFPKPVDRKKSIGKILEKRVSEKYTLTNGLWKYLQNYAAKHKAAGNGFGFGLVNLKETTRTLSARYYKDGSEILIPQRGKNPRRLTPRECARLMGYPDSFKLTACSDTRLYKQFGNSVVMPVVTAVAKEVVSALKKNSRLNAGFGPGRLQGSLFRKKELAIAA